VSALLLGVDVGTTFVKAAVLTADGVERAHGRARTPWRTVSTGAEIDPDELVATVLAAARDALERAPQGRVVGIGVTGMAETGVLLDATGKPIVPAIAWHDSRGAEEAEELGRTFGDEFTARTGLPVVPQWSVVKLRWMHAHRPEAERAVRWLNVAEWVVRSLGGEEMAELTLASRTGFLDVQQSTWWDAPLAWIGATSSFLPDPSPAGTPAGRVTRALDDAKGAVLTVAGHDHLCAAVGAGATRSDDVFDSCGTAEAFVRAVDRMPPRDEVLRLVADGITVGRHVLPEQFALLAGLESGLTRERFLTLLGVSSEEERRTLDEAALALANGAADLAVHGLDQPHASISGIFRGARPAHVWRAVLEAAEAEGAAVLARLDTIAGETRRVVASGGGVRNAAVRAVKSSTFATAFGPVEDPPVYEAGTRGAALVAGFAAGLYPSLFELPSPRPAEVEAPGE
jgi:sugar (pentulose or hexulose) kinase